MAPDNHMKPCPFCGSPAVFVAGLSISRIECSGDLGGCPAMPSAYGTTFEKAQAAWNTRAKSDAAVGTIDRLRHALSVIAGRAHASDNLMGNRQIAEAALDESP